MTADQLSELVRQGGFGRGVATFKPEINLLEYALPTRRWVLKAFAPAFRFDLAKCGLAQYIGDPDPTKQINKWICVMFALHATDVAWVCNALTPMGQGLALLFGWIGYLKQIPGSLPIGHRINFTYVEEDGPQLMFFEPQNQTEVTLTQEEIESVHSLFA